MTEYVNDESVYRERHHLVAYLAAAYDSVMVDGTEEFDNWPCVYVELPTGQASWHISPDDMDLFTSVRRGDAVWDGHSPAVKYKRLDRLTEQIATAKGLGVREPMTPSVEA